MLEICVHPARIEDIPQLMELLGIASYGFIEHLFTTLSEPGADVQSAIKSRMEDHGRRNRWPSSGLYHV
jgi:hypothetical protein